jgi:hypothetical protein
MGAAGMREAYFGALLLPHQSLAEQGEAHPGFTHLVRTDALRAAHQVQNHQRLLLVCHFVLRQHLRSCSRCMLGSFL